MEQGAQLYDLNAEAAVLSAMMIDEVNTCQALSLLEEKDFYKIAHKKIFKALSELYNNNENIGVITLINRLEENGNLESVGGTEYISNVSDVVMSGDNLDAHARIIKKYSDKRWMQLAAQYMAREVVKRDSDPSKIFVNFMEKSFEKGITSGNKKDVTHVSDVAEEAMAEIEKRIKNKDKELLGPSTGFKALDYYTHGLQPRVYILAGRPSMGKSALAKDILLSVAKDSEFPVYLGNYEMTNIETIIRMISSKTNIEHKKILLGKIDNEDVIKITEFLDLLSTKKMYLNDKPTYTLAQMKAAIHKLIIKYGGVSAIFVDHLTIVKRVGNKELRLELADMTQELKNWSKEFGVPIILLAQLNRKVEGRNDKRPILSDLGEAGAIEQNADVVMFVYRDEYYNKDSDCPNVAEIIFAKNRNGETGTARLFYNKPTIGFYDLY